ncbi:MAG: lysylphosphatidylglycerol synthase domain-containing protein [Nitrospinaceae bacterium]
MTFKLLKNKALKKKLFKFLIWIFAAGILYFCMQLIDLNGVWIEITRADSFWLFVAIFFNACILLFWSSLWKLLLPKKLSVPFVTIFQANSYMSTSCNTIPFPGGHAVGVIALARRTQVGHSVALSVLALDQLMEGFAKVFVPDIGRNFCSSAGSHEAGNSSVCDGCWFICIIHVLSGPQEAER